MKKGIDYSLERSKLLAILNTIIIQAKNMKQKVKYDSDCRSITTLCSEAVKQQAVLDKFLVEENEKLRTRIHDHLKKCGYDEHGMNELFLRDYGVKLYQADNPTLRAFITDYKQSHAQAAKELNKKK